jgi:hypothetical protein
VNHVQTSLARAPYNIDDFGAYQAAALSVRDNLIVSMILVVSRCTSVLLTPIRDGWNLSFTVHVPVPVSRLGFESFQFFHLEHRTTITNTMY